MSQTVILGVDPGLTGAVGALDERGAVVGVWDAPTVQVIKGGRRRTEPDVPAMWARLVAVRETYDVRLAVLEKVQAMPGHRQRGAVVAADGAGRDEGWGALPNFSLGTGYGLWWGLLVAAGFPLERVSPQAWRPRMMAGMARGKEADRIRALELFPGAAESLKRKRDHGRADALLLAEYGRRQAGALADRPRHVLTSRP